MRFRNNSENIYGSILNSYKYFNFIWVFKQTISFIWLDQFCILKVEVEIIELFIGEYSKKDVGMYFTTIFITFLLLILLSLSIH